MPKPRFNIYDKTWTPEVARKIEDNFKQLSRVSGSQIYANTVEPTSVKAGLLFNQMSTGAIKFLGYSYRGYTDRGVTPGANVWTDVLQDDNVTPVQVTATTEGGNVYIYASASPWSSASRRTFRVLMDGTVACTPSSAPASFLADQFGSYGAIFQKTNVIAGSHTFKLQVAIDTGAAMTYSSATLFAIEVKS